MTRRFLYGLLALIAVLTAFSCEEEDPIIIDPVFGPPKKADNCVVLSYNIFKHPDDVQIAAPDTSKIDVNLKYLMELGQDIKEGDILCIWRTIDTAPFIRKVVKRKNTGTELSLKTEPADISMLIEDADVVLKSSLMVNYFDETDSPYKKYSVDNVCHPAVILWTDPETGENCHITADDLIRTNSSWNIIDTTVNINSEFSGENLSMAINDGSVYLNCGINVNFTINDFKLRHYDYVSSGDIDINTLMKVSGSNGQKNGNLKLYQDLGPYTIIFWIGEVPIPVVVDASVHIDVDMEKNAPISFELPLVVDAKYNIGSIYRTLWSPVKDISTTYRSNLENVTSEKGITAGSSYTVRIKHRGRIFDNLASSSTFGYNIISRWNSVDEGIHSTAEFTIFGNVNNKAYGKNWLINDWKEDFLVVNSELWNKVEKYQ